VINEKLADDYLYTYYLCPIGVHMNFYLIREIPTSFSKVFQENADYNIGN